MNKAYCRYLLKKNKKLIIMHFAIVIALFCYGANANSGIFNGYGLFNLSDIKMYLYVCVIVYPIYLHLKDYTQSGNDFILSLPMKKEKRYFCELLFIFCIIILPYILFCIYQWFSGNYVLNYTTSFTNIECFIKDMITLLPVMVLYLLNNLIATKSNHLVDAIVLILTLNLVLYLMPMVLISYIDNNTVGQSIANYYYTFNVFSVIMLLVSPNYAINQLNFYSLDAMKEMGWIWLCLFVLYVFYVVALLLLNLITYKNKASETCGEKTTSRLGYPLVIHLLAFVLVCLANMQSQLSIAIIIWTFIFCGYVSAYFIKERSIHFSFKRIGAFLLIIVISLSLRSVYIASYGFNFYHNYRNEKQGNNIAIFYYGNTPFHAQLDEEKFSDTQLQQIQKEMIALQDELVETYRKNNIWWYEDTKTDTLLISYQSEGSQLDNPYTYEVNLKTGKEIKQRLEKMGFTISGIE
ncbi:MAG: hypothetical protein EOM50_03470 [Erysipelotrichia bacterium]|nr:hypothetical protein [Erysipelotrichia bacterium]